MNMPSFPMGQTENEDFSAAASTASPPLNFASQDFNQGKVSVGSPSPLKQRSPCREQSGRPSTPFPENEVQFVPTYNTLAPDPSVGGIVLDNPGSADSTYSAPGAMGAAPTLNRANLCLTGQSGDALHHHLHQQQTGPFFFTQQQSWPPESHKLYYSQSLDLDSSGVQRTNPFATGQRSASCDASQGSTTPTSPVEREERIPNSAVRRSRVWKYGRRSSGNHSDRQPFTFSVAASQAGSGAIGGIDHSSARFFGKRSFSNTRNDESWSAEPSTKQFISEERMTAEMHNLSLDGVVRQPLLPLRSTSSSSSSSSSLGSSNLSSPSLNLPSTSGQRNRGNSSDLLRHHQCHHDHRPGSRSHAEAVIADIERRLDDESDDEGVEEDMPPNQGDGHRLEMTPQLVSALKAKGASSHVLPQDIVKKIVSSPCMDLVLWRPLSVINPRAGLDTSSAPSSPLSSTGSELAPIMEVEVERERAEASSMVQHPQPYQGIPQAAGDVMQEEVLPDFDEDMDL